MRVLFGKGIAKAALRLLAAVTIAAELLPAQEPTADPLGLAVAAAGVPIQLGKYSEAARILEPAVQAAEKAGTVQGLAAALALLGAIYRYQVRYTQSERMLRRAMDMWERDPTSDPQCRLITAVNLAALYSATGRCALAEKLVTQHLSIWRNLFPYSPEVAALLHELGYAQAGLRRFAEAEVSYREALGIFEKLTGHEYGLATVLTTLGDFQARRGRYGEALENLERAVAINGRLQNEARPEPVDTLLCLAKVYTDIGQPRDAEPLFKRALAVAFGSIGPEHPLAGAVMVEYARALRALGRRSESIKMEREGKSILKRSALRDPSRYTVDVSELLGNRKNRQASPGR